MRFISLTMVLLLAACHYPPRPDHDPPPEVIDGCQDAFDYLWKHQSTTWRQAFREFGEKHPGWYLRLMTGREKDRLTPQTRCSRKQYMLVSEEQDSMWAVELCERQAHHPPVITRWPPTN